MNSILAFSLMLPVFGSDSKGVMSQRHAVIGLYHHMTRRDITIFESKQMLGSGRREAVAADQKGTYEVSLLLDYSFILW